jgi:peptide/nickel transport system ATP-binding protein
MSLLEVTDLNTSFHTQEGVVRAARDVTFSVDRGEVVGIVGESGSGKSVTARSVMNLIESPGRIESGEVRFDGEDLLAKSESELESIRGDRIGMVFQDPMTSLNPSYTVGDQIAETVQEHWDVTREQAWDRAVDLLEQVNIPDADSRASEYPHQFSGGMRQRVLIAIALACDPDLLIADEPTTALDVTIQAQILELLKDLQSELDLAVLLITHDLGVVAEIADSLVVMYAGQVVERGPVGELFHDPEHPYLRSLLASSPHRANVGRGDLLPIIRGEMPDLIEVPGGCPFHPRCPQYLGDVCESAEPEYHDVGTSPDHAAACHLHAETVEGHDVEELKEAAPGVVTGDAGTAERGGEQ